MLPYATKRAIHDTDGSLHLDDYQPPARTLCC